MTTVPPGPHGKAPHQSQAECHSLTIAVGIATASRPAIVSEAVRRLALQTRQPEAIVVCAPTPTDVAGLDDESARVTLLLGPRGAAAQRNAILDHAAPYDIVIFFDDDFVPAADYLAQLEELHITSPDVVMATGTVLKDGIRGPGLTYVDADALLAHRKHLPGDQIVPVTNGYGCNMSVAMNAIRDQRLRFDERLPLYSWLEDVDFGHRLAKHGTIVRSSRLIGVHLGVKIGRQPGRRFGYSQIANPIYLRRKGSLGLARAAYLVVRNVSMNIARSLKSEPWIDRRGRLAGNILALGHLARRRLDPRHILEL
ncbi:MAG: glycosyltransferase family 2 protein [Hyphomicrobiaceae bacterium]